MSDHPVIAILQKWPDRRSVWEDARAADDALAVVAVHRWFQRGSVPAKFWQALLDGAARRGVRVTADDVVRAHGGLKDDAA